MSKKQTKNIIEHVEKKVELQTAEFKAELEKFMKAVESAKNEFNGREDVVEVCAVQVMKLLHSRVEEFWTTRYNHCTNAELFSLLSVIDSVLAEKEKAEELKRQAYLKAKAEAETNVKQETDSNATIGDGISGLESGVGVGNGDGAIKPAPKKGKKA